MTVGAADGGGRGTVLHLIDTGGPGGAETIFLMLVSGLSRHGWSGVPVVPEEGWLAEALRERGHEPVMLGSRGAFDGSYLVRLRALIRRTGADLLQTHLMTTSVYSSAASIGTSIPIVSTFHGLPDVGPDGLNRRLKSALLRGGRNRVVFVSESLCRSLGAPLGLSSERAEVIHNGIDLEAHAPGARGAMRRRMDIPDSAPLLGAVGNFRSSKAYDVLVRAFSRVRTRVPEARLAIAGQAEGDLFEEVAALAAELGVAKGVVFAGFIHDIPAFLRDLDVFVLSSSDEGFSLATAQAMATALPVVATRCGGPEEVVEDGDNGLLVPVQDPAALADAVVRVLEDADFARRLGHAARSHVRGRFSVDVMVERYSELYRRCLAGEP